MKSAIFALAAAAALTACVKGGDADPGKNPGARIDATIRLTQHDPHSRNYQSLVPDGTAVELMNAWVVFTTGEGDAATVSAIYSLLRPGGSGHPLYVSGGKANDDGTVTLNNVPDTSTGVMIFSNFSTLNEEDPVVNIGEKVGDVKARFSSIINLARLQDALHAPAMGQSKLADTDDAKKKSANVGMNAISSRIQIKSFDCTNVSVDKIELFLNKINCQNGNAAGWLDTSDPTLYVSGSTQYPTAMYGFTHDEIGSIDQNHQMTPSDGKGWCYNLIGNDKMPQIVLKLTDVEIFSQIDGHSLGVYSAPQFVTVAGFRDKAGNKIETMEPGSIYTIEGISLSSEKLTPLPSAKPIEVTVSVAPVKWSDNTVQPEY